jgi:predicted HTH transcriptional regulator
LILKDLEDLVTIRKERESLNLEYKKEINNSSNGKKEFLKDVTGFANGGGGYLLLGIDEEDGLPLGIPGVSKTIGKQKIDEWINNVLISNVVPKLNYDLKVLENKNNNLVIIMYISESYKKPHMVTFESKNCYYVRHNNSVNVASYIEVREMFEYSNKINNKLEEFLKKRNLFDESNNDFGQSENTSHLYNKI